MNLNATFILAGVLTALAVSTNAHAADSEDVGGGSFPADLERPWIGPRYWANPMMDWRLHDGRVECYEAGMNHDLHWLTHQLKPSSGTLRMVSRMGLAADASGEGYIGFKVAITGHDPSDYRANLFDSEGIRAGVVADGRLLLGNTFSKAEVSPSVRTDMTLVLETDCRDGVADCALTVFAGGATDNGPVAEFKAKVRKEDLRGNVALACEQLGKKNRAKVKGWFSSWTIEGSKIEVHPERFFGPVLWTQYTLSRGTLRLQAHLAPLSKSSEHPVVLKVLDGDSWRDLQTVDMDPLSCTALFTIENWDTAEDVRYSVDYIGGDALDVDTGWQGVIRAEPIDKNELSLAVFTGLGGVAFPNSDLVETVRKHDPDVVFFSGDQIYEGNGGYSAVRCKGREELERATLNYLPKFWIWGWTFRDVLRDRPSILTPDDHDVYSNDLWGRGGMPAKGGRGNGGYGMHPLWVNMVEQTQMGHMPPPPDPEPLESGIKVHYCNVLYGGLSMAVLEDRKFKSAPAQALDKPIGHDNIADLESVRSDDFDPKMLDKPGLDLLGQRQEKFLEQWARDGRGVEFRAVLSGSPFANCTHGYGSLVADLDGNGWPQTARNRALRVIKRAGAVMAHGDLHIACLLQHGIDDFRDGPWSYCSPSSCATSLRVWNPNAPGENREPNAPEYTGDFLDGFGNKMTIVAVLNPDNPFVRDYRKDDGSILDNLKLRCSGFGVLRFRRPDRTCTFESWPIYDAETPVQQHRQHPGWPRAISLGVPAGKP